MTSSTTRSGRRSLAALTAALPLVAVLTSNPAKRRLADSSSRMLGSSSTTSSFASVCGAAMASIMCPRCWDSALERT